MNEREVVRRLKAFHAGAPLARGETLHVHLASDADILLVAFVRMGGESRPWGIAFGHPGSTPTILTVPEARNRDLVAEMAAKFAATLLPHLRTPGFSATPPTCAGDLRPLRQVWLPNPTHLDMLHHLAFAYTFTKWGESRQQRLNALGRACGWLFRESQRPGQQTVIVATDALREAYTFPAEDVRQGHLGFLLAWLHGSGDRDSRLGAALEAERSTIATSLDPALERDLLGRSVEAWGVANREGNQASMQRAERAIHRTLAPELERRWCLAEQALQHLRQDKRRTNAGVAELVKWSLDEQWHQHTRMELRASSKEDGPAFTPSVETDRNAAAAASRYFVHTSSAELVEGLLVHDDSELLADAIAAGDALKGRIVEVRDDAPPHTGRGRAPTRPKWVVRDEADRQLRLRVGSRVCVVGVPKRTGIVRSIREAPDATEVEIEIEGWKTRRDDLQPPHNLVPNSRALEGHEVAFVKATMALSRTKSMKVWNRNGPGAWLVHSRPGGVNAIAAEEDGDEDQQLVDVGVPA